MANDLDPDILRKLYIEDNLSQTEVAEVLGTSKNKVIYGLHKFHIYKTKQQIKLQRQRYWKELPEEHKQQRNQNVKNAFTPEVRQKVSARVKHYMNNLTDKQRKHRTEQFKKTWYSMDLKRKNQIRQNWKNSIMSRSEQQKQESIYKSVIGFKKTWAQKDPLEKQAALEKMQQTKLQRGTFNVSKQENIVFEKLCTLYKDVIRQYKSEQYPFYCDFYIPQLTIYIECNFNWTHGPHRFQNSQKDLQLLNKWVEKSKHSNFYKNAIHTWTVRDVEKWNKAQQNNLNYFVFYNMTQFYDWYNDILRNSGLTVD